MKRDTIFGRHDFPLFLYPSNLPTLSLSLSSILSITSFLYLLSLTQSFLFPKQSLQAFSSGLSSYSLEASIKGHSMPFFFREDLSSTILLRQRSLRVSSSSAVPVLCWRGQDGDLQV